MASIHKGSPEISSRSDQANIITTFSFLYTVADATKSVETAESKLTLCQLCWRARLWDNEFFTRGGNRLSGQDAYDTASLGSNSTTHSWTTKFLRTLKQKE